jgi:hypothetical protein
VRLQSAIERVREQTQVMAALAADRATVRATTRWSERDGGAFCASSEPPEGVGALGYCVRRPNVRGTHSEPRPNQLASGEDHDTSNEEQKDRDG